MNALKTKLMLALLIGGFALTTGVAFADDAPADRKAPTENETETEAPETWPATEEPESILPGECADFSDPDFRLIEKDKDDDKTAAKEPPKPKSKKRLRPTSTSCVV